MGRNKKLKFNKPEYKCAEDIPVLQSQIGIFDKDPFAILPNKRNFKVIAGLRKRAYKEGMYKNHDVFEGMVISFVGCATLQITTDVEGEEVDNGIPFNLNSLAMFCGVTYRTLYNIANTSDEHKDTYQWVKDMIECDLEDLLTRKETFHQGIANRLKCRYPETWDRNTILAETIGEDTKFNFTIE